MVNYVVRRFIGIGSTLLLLSLFTFALTRAVPGTPWGHNAQIPLTPDQEALFRAEYGMDKPVWEQYLVWLRKAMLLDFGRPFSMPELSVTQLIAKALPYSALIGGLAATLTLSIGITLGMVAAAHQNSTLDNVITGLAVLSGSLPSFVLAFILVWFFAVKLLWLPAGGWGGPKYWILPVVAYGIPGTGGVSRWTRNCMIEAMSSDYVRTAYAKGLSRSGVMRRHVLRNALVPMVTSFLPMIPGMMTGTIFIEQVFGLPGLGKFFVTASTNRDFPLVLGVTIFWAILISLTNFATDILYGVIDPRVRVGGGDK